MKFLMLAFLLSTAHAYDLDLNQEKINVGELPVNRDGVAARTFVVRRSIATPDEIYLNVTFNKEYKYCAKTSTRQVWVPTDYSPECTERRCTVSRVPGHYETETYCSQYSTASKKVSEEIKLDFDDAATLVAAEEELFTISLIQKSKNLQDFNLKGEVRSAIRAYKIKQKNGKNKLKFEVLD